MSRYIVFGFIVMIAIGGCKRKESFTFEQKKENTIGVLKTKITELTNHPSEYRKDYVIPSHRNAIYELQSRFDGEKPFLILATLERNDEKDFYYISLLWLEDGYDSVRMLMKEKDGDAYGEREIGWSDDTQEWMAPLLLRLRTFNYDRGVPFNFSKQYEIALMDVNGECTEYIDVNVPKDLIVEQKEEIGEE